MKLFIAWSRSGGVGASICWLSSWSSSNGKKTGNQQPANEKKREKKKGPKEREGERRAFHNRPTTHPQPTPRKSAMG